MHGPSEPADRTERRGEEEFSQPQIADSGKKTGGNTVCEYLTTGCALTTCARFYGFMIIDGSEDLCDVSFL